MRKRSKPPIKRKNKLSLMTCDNSTCCYNCITFEDNIQNLVRDGYCHFNKRETDYDWSCEEFNRIKKKLLYHNSVHLDWINK